MKKVFESVDFLDVRKIEIQIGRDSAKVFHDGTLLPSYDCVYAKGSHNYNTILRSLTSILSKNTYLPLSPAAFTIGHDKLLSQLKLQQADLLMPNTYLAASIKSAKNLLDKLNYPIVLKFPRGTQGKGVMFADSKNSAVSLLDAFSTLKLPVLIQEFIDTEGSDIRAFVIGDKVVGAMVRQAKDGEQRANIHLGGVGKQVLLEPIAKKLAVSAAKAIGAQVCGVDLLQTHTGPVILEVNLSPGITGISGATKIDFAKKIAEYLFEKTREFKKDYNVNGSKNLFSDLGISKGVALIDKELLMPLQFKGDSVLLPEHLVRTAGFEENTTYHVLVEKGRLTIKTSKSPN
ncbi:RimK family alpha-L-glutamate ligase [Candidatus Woesearchaeota archaeon]|nr:RimK family alpha-L-glutamate ligase [Candidatus Woesearchaeota archaeon]